MAEWQPIETAPKDGTVVWVWRESVIERPEQTYENVEDDT